MTVTLGWHDSIYKKTAKRGNNKERTGGVNGYSWRALSTTNRSIMVDVSVLQTLWVQISLLSSEQSAQGIQGLPYYQKVI